MVFSWLINDCSCSSDYLQLILSKNPRNGLLIDILWSPAEKGLTSWLSFVMSKCEIVTFQLVSWVRCGA